jgi:hypothetical protein
MSGFYARQNRTIAIILVAAAVLAATFLAVFVAHAESTIQRDAPTTRFYDNRGSVTGSAPTTATRPSSTTRGNHIGTTIS